MNKVQAATLVGVAAAAVAVILVRQPSDGQTRRDSFKDEPAAPSAPERPKVTPVRLAKPGRVPDSAPEDQVTAGAAPSGRPQTIEAMVQRIGASGAAPAEWTARADGIITKWRAEADPAVRDATTVSPFHCFLEGCWAIAAHADANKEEEFRSSLVDSPGFLDWKSGKTIIKQEVDAASGALKTLWVLVPPPD